MFSLRANWAVAERTLSYWMIAGPYGVCCGGRLCEIYLEKRRGGFVLHQHGANSLGRSAGELMDVY